MATKKRREREKNNNGKKQVNDMNYSVASQHSKGQCPLTSWVTGSERECCVRRKKKKRKKSTDMFTTGLSERQFHLTAEYENHKMKMNDTKC